MHIETLAYATVASSAMRLDDVVGLTRKLRGWADAAGSEAVGVVVTHGTDTLEEVAYGVDLLWDRDLPVVFTGAMRPGDATSPDGAANLLAALRTAAEPGAGTDGVLVVLDDRIHLASAVRKTHTSDLGTFASPTLGPVGYVVEGRPRLVLRRRVRPVALPTPAGTLADWPVALLTATLGDDGRLLAAVAATDVRGLVVEGLGGGHLPPDLAASPTLADLVARGPVVLASRTGAGETLQGTYGFPGSEADLLARGLLPAGTLTGPRARVLVTLALAGGVDVAAAVAVHGGTA